MTVFSRLSNRYDFELEVLTEKLISMLFGDGASMLAVTEARGRHNAPNDVTMLACINQVSNERCGILHTRLH